MAQQVAFKRKKPAPRVVRSQSDKGRTPRSPRHLLIAGGVILGVMGASSAWAYREVTRTPDPSAVPHDPALLPPATNETDSELFPRNAALYCRVSLDTGVVSLARTALSGLSFGGMGPLAPLSRLISPGLNAMAGFPAAQEGDPSAGTDPGAQLTRAFAQQLDHQISLAIYPTYATDQPIGITVVAGIKDPQVVIQLLEQARRTQPGSRWLDAIRVEDRRVWFSNAILGFSGLRDDPDFKGTMAYLPEDRFASVYVNAERLRSLSDAYSALRGEAGSVTGVEASPAVGILADPDLRQLLDDFDREGGTRQHFGLAATNRLGLVQVFHHSDWQPKDPEQFKRELGQVLRKASSASLLGLQQAIGT